MTTDTYIEFAFEVWFDWAEEVCKRLGLMDKYTVETDYPKMVKRIYCPHPEIVRKKISKEIYMMKQEAVALEGA